jgi:D-alanine-D-alanine ligase
MDTMQIAVLMGGDSSEREISLRSGQAVADALRAHGHAVDEVVLGDPLAALGSAAVRGADVVFVALHGGAGEDGRIQALLELTGRPFVGSTAGPCAVAMDKLWTKHICRSIGVPTPAWAELPQGAGTAQVVALACPLGWPVVLKPVAEGSTLGVTIAQDQAQLVSAWSDPGRRPGRWMLERYIKGRELTLPVLLGEAMAEIEMRPKQGFYDYANKYTPGRTAYDCPAAIAPAQRDALARHGLALFRALQLRDMARIDFRMDGALELFCLEANAIPGMTATSLFPMGARARGIEFPQVCERLCRAALARSAGTPPPRRVS